MPDELPPNKPCSRCGAENIASADRCFECGAAFERAYQPSDEVFRIGETRWPGAPGPGLTVAMGRGTWTRPFLRFMGVVGGTILAYTLSGRDGLSGAFAVIVFVSLGGMTLVVHASRDARARGGRPSPGDGFLDGFDVLLRSVGCLFSLLVLAAVSLFAFFLVACTCSR